jgi:hypothetical protein
MVLDRVLAVALALSACAPGAKISIRSRTETSHRAIDPGRVARIDP